MFWTVGWTDINWENEKVWEMEWLWSEWIWRYGGELPKGITSEKQGNLKLCR